MQENDNNHTVDRRLADLALGLGVSMYPYFIRYIYKYTVSIIFARLAVMIYLNQYDKDYGTQCKTQWSSIRPLDIRRISAGRNSPDNRRIAEKI